MKPIPSILPTPATGMKASTGAEAAGLTAAPLPTPLPAPLSASTALQALSTGQLRAIELYEHCCKRIQHHNPHLNALVTLNLEQARQQAEAADRLRAHSNPATCPPLLGLPFSVKDAFATQGLRTTSSTPALAHYQPERDATLVARLKAAGGILMGKSNLSELAGDPQCWSPLFGPTRNPWDENRTPGGSSGGSAVAIALGFSLLEAGSDIAGSIRIPAAYCGVTALKATTHSIPRTGHIPHLPGQLRTVRHLLAFGLFGREVADLKLGFPLIAGPDGEDQEIPPQPTPQPKPIPEVHTLPPPHSPSINEVLSPRQRPLRVAWWDDFEGIPLCPRTRTGFSHAVHQLEAAGHQLQRSRPPGFDFEQAWRAFGLLLASQIGPDLPGWQRHLMPLARHLLPRHLHLSQSFMQGMHFSLKHYHQALAQRDTLIQSLESFLGHYDLWLCPTAPTVAYPAFALSRLRPPPPLQIGDEKLPYIEATLSHTAPFSLTGNPVVSLPVGLVDGLPLGLQAIGRRWQEMQLLTHCQQLEAALGHGPIPPQVA